MKKLIAFVLIAVMILGLTACGNINKAEVAVLWSGSGKVEAPNSLINSVERAMYLEKISYKHYGANGDSDLQMEQVRAALDSGCAVLAVELLNIQDTQTVVDMAKEKDIPVVLFNSSVVANAVNSYDKCFFVGAASDSSGKILSKKITDTYKDAKSVEGLDRNGDGKLNYLCLGNVTAEIESEFLVPVTADVGDLTMQNYDVTTKFLFFFKKTTEYGKLVTPDDDVVELIITADDRIARNTLLAMQELGLNTDKLATHFVPIYTVGNEEDYKAYTMKTMPQPPVAYEKWATPEAQEKLTKEEKKQLDNWWSKDEAVVAWKNSNEHICSLSTVEWKDLGSYIYTTTEVIGAGRLSGAAVYDLDGIAIAMATVLRNMIKGTEPLKGIDETFVQEGKLVYIPYTNI